MKFATDNPEKIIKLLEGIQNIESYIKYLHCICLYVIIFLHTFYSVYIHYMPVGLFCLCAIIILHVLLIYLRQKCIRIFTFTWEAIFNTTHIQHHTYLRQIERFKPII
jgi:uncharacterized SAM-dependent methyltransferase